MTDQSANPSDHDFLPAQPDDTTCVTCGAAETDHPCAVCGERIGDMGTAVADGDPGLCARCAVGG